LQDSCSNGSYICFLRFAILDWTEANNKKYMIQLSSILSEKNELFIFTSFCWQRLFQNKFPPANKYAFC